MLGCEFFINYRLIFRGKGRRTMGISIWQASSPPLSWRACPFFGTLGEILTEKSGNLNLGVEV